MRDVNPVRVRKGDYGRRHDGHGSWCHRADGEGDLAGGEVSGDAGGRQSRTPGDIEAGVIVVVRRVALGEIERAGRIGVAARGV